jgi:retron-type reverse transcriptase
VKPCKNIYTQICDFENLYEAYRKAALGKRFRSDALAFADALEANLHDIRAELLTENYRVGRYREFYIYEPKKRLIMALPFRDRVVQWAVYRVVNPLIARGYIDDSYACIDGRGLHLAVLRLQYWAQFATRGGTGAHYL